MEHYFIMIDVGYACGGIEVVGNAVVDSPPIFRWMKNKTWTDVQRWVNARGTWRIIKKYG